MSAAPPNDDELDEFTRTIQQAARDILAGFARERISPRLALAITGCVAGRLFGHVGPELRADFIACLQDYPPGEEP